MGCYNPEKRAEKGLVINTLCALYVKLVGRSPLLLTITKARRLIIDHSVIVAVAALPPVSLSGID